MGLLGLAFGIGGLGCHPTSAQPGATPPALYQFAPFSALIRGRYDGELRIDELLRHGDFGLGAPDGLDGELVVLGGRALQVRHDGTVHPYGPERTTAAACVTFFRPTFVQRLDERHPLDRAAFEARLDEIVPAHNRFVALRITGDFTFVRARSAPAPARPYPDLAEALERQMEFDFRETKGTFVGFRMPSFASGFNFPGHHFHFLTADERSGGHVLDYAVRNVTVEVAELSEIVLALPKSPDFGTDDLTLPPSSDATRIERGGAH